MPGRLKAGNILYQALLWIPAIFIVLTSVYTMVGHHVSTTVQDQLVIYPSYFSDSLWDFVVTQRNGHRIILPALVTAADIQFAYASNQLLVGVIFICLLSIIACFGWAIFKSKTIDQSTRTSLMALVLALFFWFGQHRCLGIPFTGVIVYIASAFAFSALVLFSVSLTTEDQKKKRFTFWSSMLAALGASTSFGVGMAIWPALIILCVKNRSPLKVWGGLALCMSIGTGLYFLLPDGERVTRALDIDVLSTLKFLAGFAGGVPFYSLSYLSWFEGTPVKAISFSMGVLAQFIACGLLVKTVLKRSPSDHLENLGVGLLVFSVGLSLLISVGRSSWGSFSSDVLAARYLIWSVHYWAGFIILVTLSLQGIMRNKTWMRWVTGLCTALLILALIPSHNAGAWRTMSHDYNAKAQALPFEVGLVNEKDLIALSSSPHVGHRRTTGLLELLPPMREGNLNFFHEKKYLLMGTDAAVTYALEEAQACHASFTTIEAVRRSELFPPPENEQDEEGGSEMVAVRLSGRVPLDVRPGAFLIFVDAEKTVIGLGVIEKQKSRRYFGEDSLRSAGYVDITQMASRTITPYIAAPQPSNSLCRLPEMDLATLE
jgi:hypothetical protein